MPHRWRRPCRIRRVPHPRARCVQVMRIDAGGAVHSFHLELGGDLGLPQHLLAALGIGLRQGFGRGGRGGKRRGPDSDRGPLATGGGGGGIGRTYTILIIYVRQQCEPPRCPYVVSMPGRQGSPRGPSGELLRGLAQPEAPGLLHGRPSKPNLLGAPFS